MLSLIDPKPLGAFVEYTVKPLLEEVRDILDLADSKSIERAFWGAIFIFIFDKLITCINSLLITGIICLTILRILSSSQNILQ